MKSVYHRNQRGFTTAATLSFLFCFSMIGMGMGSMTTTQHVNARRTADRQQSSALAESGMNVLFESIRSDMNTDGSYSSAIPVTNVTLIRGGNTVKVGSYSARILDVQMTSTDYGGDWDKRRSFVYTFRIEGTGRTWDGFTTKLIANFTGTIERALVRTETGGPSGDLLQQNVYWFPMVAMVSIEKVNIATNGGVRTYAPDGLSGHIMANKGVSLWGAKSGTSNPNVVDIQGQFLVPQGSAYDWTVSKDGLENPNGSKNYRSPSLAADGGFSGNPANTVLRMPGEVNFADEAEVNDWRGKWNTIVAKPTSTKYTSTLKTQDVAPRPGDGWKVITTPAVIDGDLEVASGEALRLLPSSSNPKNNVLVVRGNVKNLGALLNLGVTIVMEGKYTDGPSSEYKVSSDGSLFANDDLVAQRAGFISTAKEKEAFRFRTNSSARTGLIYAALGGIQVEGANVEFTGSLVAGGRGGDGGIDINPGGGNSFVVRYDSWAVNGGSLEITEPAEVEVTYNLGGITRGFQPTKLFNINEKRN
jgi:hypothetical protein